MIMYKQVIRCVLIVAVFCFLPAKNVFSQEKECHRLQALNDFFLYVDTENRAWAVPYPAKKEFRQPQLLLYDIQAVAASYWDIFYFLKKDNSLWCLNKKDIVRSKDTDLLLGGQPEFKFVLDSVKKISTYGSTAFAIKEDNSLWVWGRPIMALGYNSLNCDSDIVTPKQILDNVAYANPGALHAIVLKKDNTLWAWGDNTCGALGIGSYDDSYTPVQIDTSSLGNRKIISIAVGKNTSYALTEEGQIWGWGDINFLCGEKDPPNRPQRVENSFTARDTIQDITNIYVIDESKSAVFTSTGEIWIWYGHVNSMPVKKLENCKAVSFYGECSVAIKNDGSLWAWGKDSEGYSLVEIPITKK